MSTKIDKLIINSPFEEPQQHWLYRQETREFELRPERRRAGYYEATPQSDRSDEDPGVFKPLDEVNKLRELVRQWRERRYMGATGVSRKLLNHWYDEEQRENRFFFCQLEAIETLIFLTEAPESERAGVTIGTDGGDFSRWCSKMATGTGKTVVMAMLIAWQVLNAVNSPDDERFSKYILAVTPGLTVKNRLSVLKPSAKNNYYEEFNIVPSSLLEKLRQGRVTVHNWHFLSWENSVKKSVDKRGPKSDEAYVREVLSDFPTARNIVVINDEAHHAWRVNPNSPRRNAKKEEQQQATVWVGGLDRIHRTRGIIRCYDLTATPFSPSGKRSGEEALFDWIVSDFGLNDAIESGLVKTPRLSVRDDAVRSEGDSSKMSHIYKHKEVKDDLNRRGAQVTESLPALVINAYSLLGKDWQDTRKVWKLNTPPVMITVTNRTETAARIEYTIKGNMDGMLPKELCEPSGLLRIDSEVLKKAESRQEVLKIDEAEAENLTQQESAEQLREKVYTVGKEGEAGGQIQNVISVGMLSEGWDAKTVTHIMGLRAFTSHLLCEQVVGRGLRRMSYDLNEDGLFEPEYVSVFGIPFKFLPHEEQEVNPPTPKPRTLIKPERDKAEHEITWPNLIRVSRDYTTELSLNVEHAKETVLDPTQSVTLVEIAASMDGKPLAEMTDIDLREIADDMRLQKLIFRVAKRVFEAEKPTWKGTQDYLLGQIVRLVQKYMRSDKVKIKNAPMDMDKRKQKVLFMLNVGRIINTIWASIAEQNTERLVPIFDPERATGSTADMRPWHTSKPCERSAKTHINFVVLDSGWEGTEAFMLDKSPLVTSFAKNSRLNFAIFYSYQGSVRRFYPDFIVQLANGVKLVLEVKGRDDDQNRVKRDFLADWVEAVNTHGGFGKWANAVSFDPSDVERILSEHGQ